jgi:hypothetical protein
VIFDVGAFMEQVREEVRRVVREELERLGVVGTAGEDPELPRWLAPHRHLLGTMGDAALARKLRRTQGVIRAWRVKLGVEPYRKHADPPWLARIRDRLGTESDGALAREVGVPLQVLRHQRVRLGIPAFGRRRRTLDCVRDRLGTVPDAELAREAGVTRERIRQFRIELGIDLTPDAIEAVNVKRRAVLRRRAERATPMPEAARPLFGVEPDAEIARRFAVHCATVNRWRREHGLPPPPAPRRDKSRLWAFIDLFGVESDAEIARRAGVTIGSVAVFRRYHPELPASPYARRGATAPQRRESSEAE